jgi:hypothetical protein
MRSQRKLFIATALLEIGAALSVLSLPALVIWLLFGVAKPAPETLTLGRLAGAGLLAFGSSCWFARNDRGSPAQHGLLLAILIYNVSACAVLAIAGSIMGISGVALWPSVLLHAVMTMWCAANLRAWEPHA